MFYPDCQFTKARWFLTIFGLGLYLVDVGTDISLAVKYFLEEQYVWSGLTVLFILVGLLVTQLFSYAWYLDDLKDVLMNPEGKETVENMSKAELVVLHVCGFGVLTRYSHLLRRAYKVLWRLSDTCTVEDRREEHHHLFCLATDLSMLKLFESFLESTPQLMLQMYIVLNQGECSYMQYVSMGCSFFNTAWALVDYRRCLRRSLVSIHEMPSGLPTVVYLMYKLATITSHILSYSLLLVLSVYTTVGLCVLWLVGTACAHLVKTNFCSSKGLELVYQAVIGVILTFTFFNIQGKDTKVVMTVYYFFHSLINVTAPLLLMYLRPEIQPVMVLLPVIYTGLLVGLISLILYYLYLHPRGKWFDADEVDGLGKETEAMRRVRAFLQP